MQGATVLGPVLVDSGMVSHLLLAVQSVATQLCAATAAAVALPRPEPVVCHCGTWCWPRSGATAAARFDAAAPGDAPVAEAFDFEGRASVRPSAGSVSAAAPCPVAMCGEGPTRTRGARGGSLPPVGGDGQAAVEPRGGGARDASTGACSAWRRVARRAGVSSSPCSRCSLRSTSPRPEGPVLSNRFAVRAASCSAAARRPILGALRWQCAS